MKGSKYFLMAMIGAVAAVAAYTMGLDAAAAGMLIAPAAAAVDPEKIQAQLDAISGQLKAFAEQAQKEIKAHSTLSAETKASVDQLLIKQGELQARLATAEQLVAQIDTRGSDHGRPQSIGAQLASNEEYLAWAGRPSTRFSMEVKAAITESDSSAGDLIVPKRVPGVFGPGQQRLTIRDLISFVRTTSNSVEFVRETGFTNNADVVSENPVGLKPESNITFEADTAPVATIAHWIHASKQVLADIPMLQGYIDGRLRYGLKLKEETQLLKGSGVGLNIDGIYTQATAYSQPAGTWVQNETIIDRLRLALLQVELAEAYADGIVLSPVDWTNIELTKTTLDTYLFTNPRSAQLPGLWGRNVVPTPSMSPGDFLVGAFGGGIAVQGHDREDMTLSVATQDDRDFVKNMVKILLEERLALTVYRPEAFVKGDFDGVQSES